mmetsp:Transcript_9273/g.28660  ORF Transcript_9273/g.28660 Transcript_9273/m.28660 type:complete len:930 (+) Transcript_9273:154-2943(+)|eukprot:CAMPEP_0174243190 /NCGR_PEP_ID=MMETSP0417-20130205/30716_1 /TAXON_ID=242541 /ORGANISM="Mayorella sp, Strain BSH-02190019" /LENGTH=929 /DNA_ID=CAMNT_0015322665 /DNA_START=136 /DNA_END=2925 /DNA_ORIENTATION=+
MFALQVLSLSCDTSRCKQEPRSAPLYFSLSSEGQRPRSFLAGRFRGTKTQSYESLVHITYGTPITVGLSFNRGRFFSDGLGVHTLYAFLQDQAFEYDLQTLSFGDGSSIVYRVLVHIRRLRSAFSFSLKEFVCVRQASLFSLQKDRVYAEVKFNCSPHSRLPTSSNVYSLGHFQSHDVSAIFSSNNLTFTVLSNFTITFFVRGLLGKHILGTLEFVPWEEVQNNRRATTPSLFDALGEQSDLSVNMTHQGGLVSMVNNDFHKPNQLLSNGQSQVSKKFLFTSSNGAMYEVIALLERTCALDLSTAEDDLFSSRSHHLLQLPLSKPSDENLVYENRDIKLSSANFTDLTAGNHIEVMVDGRETFRRYYEIMMQARHSIDILAWELSLSFGLIETSEASNPGEMGLKEFSDPSRQWISLEDVILARALRGVRTRIIVWRHGLFSFMNRYLYLGSVSIEHELVKLERRAHALNLKMRILRTRDAHRVPDFNSFADPYEERNDANIVVMVVSTPHGFISSHHEKLVLIDARCPNHALAFMGGFDIARGRYDQSLHQVPSAPLSKWSVPNPHSKTKRYSGWQVQPLLRRNRFLWHDLQLLLEGPAVQRLHLHFVQRWVNCFTGSKLATTNETLSIRRRIQCDAHRGEKMSKLKPESYRDCTVRLNRAWKGIIDGHFLFNEYCRILYEAKESLYIEHQYPFQNAAISFHMCEALRRNPKLKVIIVTPVRTDLPSGVVGHVFSWSRDRMLDHLLDIYRLAPDRVGVYGLVRQHHEEGTLKSIYVHSKLVIVDNEFMVTGSANMDNNSFFYGSELTATIHQSDIAKDTRVRLLQEHLGNFFRPEMKDDFNMVFNTFRDVAKANMRVLEAGDPLIGRPVPLVPRESYEFLISKVYYPSKLSRFLHNLGVNSDFWTERAAQAVLPLIRINPIHHIRSRL